MKKIQVTASHSKTILLIVCIILQGFDCHAGGCFSTSQKRIVSTQIVQKTVFAKGAEKQKALLAAAQQGDKDTCSRLLEAGADINTRDIHSRTPFYVAVSAGHKDLCSLLLDWDAYISYPNPLMTYTESTSEGIVTITKCILPFEEVIENGIMTVAVRTPVLKDCDVDNFLSSLRRPLLDMFRSQKLADEKISQKQLNVLLRYYILNGEQDSIQPAEYYFSFCVMRFQIIKQLLDAGASPLAKNYHVLPETAKNIDLAFVKYTAAKGSHIRKYYEDLNYLLAQAVVARVRHSSQRKSLVFPDEIIELIIMNGGSNLAAALLPSY